MNGMAADILNVIIEYVFSFPHIHTYTHIHAEHAHKGENTPK